MRTFDAIYQTACLHKGGQAYVDAALPVVKTSTELIAQPDAYYLSAMSRRIFRAGLKHSMVDAKWPDFERVFSGFGIDFCAMMSDEFIETCMSNRSIIRHLGKLKSIRSNAQFMLDIRSEYGCFGHYLSDWPVEDTVELWFELKKQGAQLGGASAAQFLRMVGRDTFFLSSDVVSVLTLEKVVDKAPTSKGDLRRVQVAFNEWREQSGRHLSEISRVLSFAAV